MIRRQFITLLGGAAVAWPLAARAQQPERMRRIGVLMNLTESDPEGQVRIGAFREGLGKLSWTEGRELKIDYRWFGGDPARARAYAAELVKLKPDVIFASTTSSLAALQQETRSVPIVFAQVADPVGAGFVARLARPGKNVPPTFPTSRRFPKPAFRASRRPVGSASRRPPRRQNRSSNASTPKSEQSSTRPRSRNRGRSRASCRCR